MAMKFHLRGKQLMLMSKSVIYVLSDILFELIILILLILPLGSSLARQSYVVVIPNLSVIEHFCASSLFLYTCVMVYCSIDWVNKSKDMV